VTSPASDVSAPPVAILQGGEPIDIVVGGGHAIAIAWPGTGSHFRSMHRIDLEQNGATIPLRHESEAVYFVAAGHAAVHDLHAGETRDLATRSMVYVPRRTGYAFEARGPVTLLGGPCPPDPALYGGAPGLDLADGRGDGPVRVYDAEREGVPLPVIGKNVRLVVWPGTGADVATMNFAELEPGEENAPHAHAESDDAIAILAGEGSIDDLASGETHSFVAGDVVFVRAGVPHKVKADRGVPIVSAGGPCPPDYGMLRALGLV
jgi:mannose-6-phosphate isomerase-like protein (cupin superfamily)